MWLIVAITSYFISAGVYVADKFLLSKQFHSSVVYAFYVGIWSIFNVILLFLSPWRPNFSQLAVDLAAGALFLITLVFWYKALHQSEATRVVPIVGALTPIFSLLLSALFFGDILTATEFIAFFILIFGGILISIKQTKVSQIKRIIKQLRYWLGHFTGEIHAEHRPMRRLIINSTLSAFLFACFYVLMKYIYSRQPFIGGFVWSRFGTFLAAVLILARPKWRQLIQARRQHASQPKHLAFFVFIRLAGALAFILLNWAISLGNVALVNALQGTQYLFLILLVLLISSQFPRILKEELGREVLVQKIIGVMLVSLGLWVLTL